MHHKVDGGGGEVTVKLVPDLHDHEQEGHRADQPKAETDRKMTSEVEVDKKLENVVYN